MTNYISASEAARIIGIVPTTLANWRYQGKGPAFIRISSRCVRYRWEDLQVWIASKTVRFE
jgi:hypothetical protein